MPKAIPALVEYQAVIDAGAAVKTAAAPIGGACLVGATEFAACAPEQLLFMEKGLTMQRPGGLKLPQLFKAVTAHVTAIEKAAEKEEKAKGEHALHLRLLADLARSFDWVQESGTARFVGGQMTTAKMASNKINARHKADEQHKAFVKAVEAANNALEQYAKAHHGSGFAWGTVKPSAPNFRKAPGGTLTAMREESANVAVLVDRQARDAGHRAVLELLTKVLDEHNKVMLMIESTPLPESRNKQQSAFNQLTTSIEAVKAHKAGAGALAENQFKLAVECATALGWMLEKSKIGSFLDEYAGSCKYATTKITSEVKKAAMTDDDAELQTNYCTRVTAVIQALKEYTAQHHANGLVWNCGNTEVSSAFPVTSTAAAFVASGTTGTAPPSAVGSRRGSGAASAMPPQAAAAPASAAPAPAAAAPAPKPAAPAVPVAKPLAAAVGKSVAIPAVTGGIELDKEFMVAIQELIGLSGVCDAAAQACLAQLIIGAQEQHRFLTTAATEEKPSPMKTRNLMKPIETAKAEAKKIGDVKDASLHLKIVYEASRAFEWLLTNEPLQITSDQGSACMFLGRKIVAANKGCASNEQFVNSICAATKALGAFVKDHFTTGFQWGVGTVNGPVVEVAVAKAEAPQPAVEPAGETPRTTEEPAVQVPKATEAPVAEPAELPAEPEPEAASTEAATSADGPVDKPDSPEPDNNGVPDARGPDS